MVDQPILQRTLLVDGNYFNVRANVFENRKIAIWDSVDDGVDVWISFVLMILCDQNGGKTWEY